MDFSKALLELKMGKLIRRHNWMIHKRVGLVVPHGNITIGEGDYLHQPYFLLIDQGKCYSGYFFTVDDILAIDWKVHV